MSEDKNKTDLQARREIQPLSIRGDGLVQGPVLSLFVIRVVTQKSERVK